MKVLDKPLNIDSVKTHIADVIIGFNFIEQRMNHIIQEYIDSSAEYFVRNILLNSLILNVGSKLKILNYIVVTEQVDLPKSWMNAFHMLMKNRNLIAHSDNLLGFDQDLEELEFVFNKETGKAAPSPIWATVEPDIPIFDNGRVDYLEISKILCQFDEYQEKVDVYLKEMLDVVSARHAKPFPEDNIQAAKTKPTPRTPLPE